MLAAGSPKVWSLVGTCRNHMENYGKMISHEIVGCHYIQRKPNAFGVKSTAKSWYCFQIRMTYLDSDSFTSIQQDFLEVIGSPVGFASRCTPLEWSSWKFSQPFRLPWRTTQNQVVGGSACVARSMGKVVANHGIWGVPYYSHH